MARILISICFVFVLFPLKAQVIYVDALKGDDSFAGTQSVPIKTLKKAAELINNNKGYSFAQVVLAEGVYFMDSAVIFKPSTKYSVHNRLTIRAEILPDDPDWTPSKMPVLLPALFDQKKDKEGTWSNGLQIEVSHVTIQGVKIMGSPIYEHIEKGKIIRSYPIVWDGEGLKDLLIKQCLFLGEEQILPLHLGIYAAGDNVVVDHCVFYNCKVGVLFVNYHEKETVGNALTNNLFIGSYGAAVWIMNTSEDFVFKGNSIVNSNYALILEEGTPKQYTIEESLFSGIQEMVGTGTGALLNFSPLTINHLNFGAKVRITGKRVDINFDQGDRQYLHILGEEQGLLESGLFNKN